MSQLRRDLLRQQPRIDAQGSGGRPRRRQGLGDGRRTRQPRACGDRGSNGVGRSGGKRQLTRHRDSLAGPHRHGGCQAGLRARRVRRGPRQVGHGKGRRQRSHRTGFSRRSRRSRRLCGGCRAWLASQKWQVAWLGLAGRCCAHQRRRNGRRCRHGTSGRRPARGDWGRSGRDGSRNNRAPDGGDPIASASRGPQFRGLQHRHRWRRRYRRCHRRHSRRKRTRKQAGERRGAPDRRAAELSVGPRQVRKRFGASLRWRRDAVCRERAQRTRCRGQQVTHALLGKGRRGRLRHNGPAWAHHRRDIRQRSGGGQLTALRWERRLSGRLGRRCRARRCRLWRARASDGSHRRIGLRRELRNSRRSIPDSGRSIPSRHRLRDGFGEPRRAGRSRQREPARWSHCRRCRRCLGRHDRQAGWRGPSGADWRRDGSRTGCTPDGARYRSPGASWRGSRRAHVAWSGNPARRSIPACRRHGAHGG